MFYLCKDIRKIATIQMLSKKTWDVLMKKFFQKTIGPLFLMITCPPAVILAWYINTNMQGSLLNFAHIALQNGIMNTIWQIWQPVFFGTHIAWKIILIFMAIQLLLMRIVPGKTVTGPETANGNITIYKLSFWHDELGSDYYFFCRKTSTIIWFAKFNDCMRCNHVILYCEIFLVGIRLFSLDGYHA